MHDARPDRILIGVIWRDPLKMRAFAVVKKIIISTRRSLTVRNAALGVVERTSRSLMLPQNRNSFKAILVRNVAIINWLRCADKCVWRDAKRTSALARFPYKYLYGAENNAVRHDRARCDLKACQNIAETWHRTVMLLKSIFTLFHRRPCLVGFSILAYYVNN